MCSSLGLLTTGMGRKPSGIVTVLLKKYWPGLYRAVSDGPDGPKKLALKWDDYHAAPCGVMTTTTEDGRRVAPTCAQVVLRTFWVRLLFQSTQIKILCTLDFVLTHESHHCCLVHDCRSSTNYPPTWIIRRLPQSWRR
jgi:hypothetical protein